MIFPEDMVKVTKLAVLFQLLFFCLAIISFLTFPILDSVNLIIYEPSQLDLVINNLLKTLALLLFVSSPAFVSLYMKLKKDHPSIVWRIIPLITNLVLIFATIFSFRLIFVFSLLTIFFLLLSSFFGSLTLFQINKLKWKN